MITIPQRLLGEALLRSEAEHSSKIAIIAKEKEYTYSELKICAENLAFFLSKSGVKKGDRVAIYMNNSWESVISIYAATIAGAVFSVVNPQTKANKLQFILDDSEACVLIAEKRLYKEVKESICESKYLRQVLMPDVNPNEFDLRKPYSIDDFNLAISKIDENVSLPRFIPNDLAALIYTSGSTGFPKGVMMTHQNMVFTSWSLVEYLRLREDDKIILLSPLAFDYGLYQLLMSVTIGGTLIVEQSFAFPSTVYKRIRQYGVTIFPGVPTTYAMMIATNKKSPISFESIRTITNTAAALPHDSIPELKKIFPKALIFKMYGLTECKRVCYLEPELVDEKPMSVGKAIPGTEVFLLSPEGNSVPPNKPGILHVRGPHVMLGYWKNEKLSNEMLKSGFFPYEQILCSNDWFTMDEEGFLYFQGRNDDIIKTRGEKVSPIEIENIIYSIKGVREVAVFGIPDEIMGESIIAYVTKHDSDEVDEKRIINACAAHLEIFMIPQKVVFIDQMPKSPNGKIDKKILKRDIVN